MTVGSFTSISLDPPLVGFFVDSGSTTLKQVMTSGVFTVNFLDDRSEALSHTFSGGPANRFAGIPLVSAPPGAPRLAGASGWLDCVLETRVQIGDHDLVVGRVVQVDVPAVPRSPLIFFGGAHRSLGAHTPPDSPPGSSLDAVDSPAE